MNPRSSISVVIRFRDEAPWLGAVLRAVRAQRCSSPVEIVASDNRSTDGSRVIAARYADRLLDLDDYRPGAALNAAIAASGGDIVVILSAHALPASDGWLTALTEPLADSAAISVYGAQVYPLYSQFLDKRDLDIFCDPRPRKETQDSDFWNANSAFRRSVWTEQPFETSVFELEDHYWSKCQLPVAGRYVRYEPTAPVYHYGHDARNDRTFLPPDRPSDREVIRHSADVLERPDEPWPAVMSAGLAIGSLSDLPEACQAIPALGRHLCDHADFDVRWRMAHVLGRIGTAEAIPYLLKGLRDPSFYPRDESAWSLARLGSLAVPTLLIELDTLATEFLPFAALALGRSRDRLGERRALEVLAACLADGRRDIVRDALYFLGEVASADGADGLAGPVARCLASDDDDLARAAAWCWGMLACHHPFSDGLSAATCGDVATGHHDETVRAEAVIATGRLARARGSGELLRNVAAALSRDPSGRVRYGAMQTLRLAADAGWKQAARAAVAHEADTDFGVAFERDLVAARAGAEDVHV